MHVYYVNGLAVKQVFTSLLPNRTVSIIRYKAFITGGALLQIPILRWAGGGGGGVLDKRRLVAGSFTVIVLYLRSLLKVCAW